MSKQITLGLFGAGRIGRLHAENIANNFRAVEIKTLADVFLNDDMQKWAESIGIRQCTKDPDDIFNDAEIDAVLICSSSDTHADFIIRAAKKGKDIFCEKPIDHDIARIKEALAEVEKAGVKLQVGFVRRFDHNHRKVYETVRAGKCGQPHIIKITSRDPAPPPIEYLKRSGGLFYDQSIHDFDMARFLSGSEVDEVFAAAEVLVDKEIGEIGDVDTALVTLKMENGAMALIDNSRKAVYGYDQRTEVFGSKGCVIAANDTPNTTRLYTEDGVESEKPYWFFLERYNDAFIEEIKDFVDMLISDTEPQVTGQDGLISVYIAKAATLSIRENRPVKISEVM